jgi:hypothetical protein
MLFVALFIFYNSDVVIHGHMIGFRFRTKFKILEKNIHPLGRYCFAQTDFSDHCAPPPPQKNLFKILTVLDEREICTCTAALIDSVETSKVLSLTHTM